MGHMVQSEKYMGVVLHIKIRHMYVDTHNSQNMLIYIDVYISLKACFE